MREGKFDNLPGAGKPLDLEPMPADENARMTWWMLRILKNNDFTPDEVHWRRQIDRLKDELDSGDDRAARRGAGEARSTGSCTSSTRSAPTRSTSRWRRCRWRRSVSDCRARLATKPTEAGLPAESGAAGRAAAARPKGCRATQSDLRTVLSPCAARPLSARLNRYGRRAGARTHSSPLSSVRRDQAPRAGARLRPRRHRAGGRRRGTATTSANGSTTARPARWSTSAAGSTSGPTRRPTCPGRAASSASR